MQRLAQLARAVTAFTIVTVPTPSPALCQGWIEIERPRERATPTGPVTRTASAVQVRLSDRIARVRSWNPPSLVEEFAIEARRSWQWLAGAAPHALPAADPWVRQAAPRIPACLPASGEDLDVLLAQIGLTRGLGAGSP